MRIRAAALVLSAIAASAGEPARADAAPPTLREIADAVTELDVKRARELVARLVEGSVPLDQERLRLALYAGDCDGAGAIASSLGEVASAAPLASVARACARAVAGSLVVEDEARGLWIRLQDGEDRALVPHLSDVAVRARAAVARDLGVELPRPLRIDLVRDAFTLSAVSGLPLPAIETTGTVAVARFGRVSMISPRAAPGGYPWQDTLAHEITHLALSRATRDAAPLWLQEGLAKRGETRWRAARPFDGEPPPDEVSRSALEVAQAVPLDRLGPSIAMLPDADTAALAFAEVESFVSHWVVEHGVAALRLLLLDLRELGAEGADAALRSVSGHDLAGELLLWQHALLSRPAADRPPADPGPDLEEARGLARAARLGEMLHGRAAFAPAAERLGAAAAAHPRSPALAFHLGRSLLAAGREADAAEVFGSLDRFEGLHAGWLALHGRLRRAGGDPEAGASFALALALDPLLEEAACEGAMSVPLPAGGRRPEPAPSDAIARALCESARKMPRE